MFFLIVAAVLQNGTAVSVAPAAVPSVECIYDGLAPEERVALLGTAVADGRVTEAVHVSAFAKTKVIASACIQKTYWTQQQAVQVASYAAARSELAVAGAGLAERGVEASLVDEIVGDMTLADRNALLLGKMDSTLVLAIISSSRQKPGFRKAALDTSQAVSADRLLGRAIAAKVAMEAAEQGNLNVPGIPR